MWRMRTANYDDRKAINKHLKDDFEPFAIAPQRDRQPDKIYFRRLEPQILVATEEQVPDNTPWEAMGALVSRLEAAIDKMPTQLEVKASTVSLDIGNVPDLLNDFLNGLREIMRPLDYSLKVDPRIATLDNRINSVPENMSKQATSDSDSLPVTPSYNSSEDSQPAGDSFRVVDDVPDIPTSRYSPQQESIIAQIRGKHPTGITINPVQSDGSVVVLADKIRYRILASGTVQSEETRANLNSLGI